MMMQIESSKAGCQYSNIVILILEVSFTYIWQEMWHSFEAI